MQRWAVHVKEAASEDDWQHHDSMVRQAVVLRKNVGCSFPSSWLHFRCMQMAKQSESNESISRIWFFFQVTTYLGLASMLLIARFENCAIAFLGNNVPPTCAPHQTACLDIKRPCSAPQQLSRLTVQVGKASDKHHWLRLQHEKDAYFATGLDGSFSGPCAWGVTKCNWAGLTAGKD